MVEQSRPATWAEQYARRIAQQNPWDAADAQAGALYRLPKPRTPEVLVALEDVLLAYDPYNTRRLEHGRFGGFLRGTWTFTWTLLAAAPLANAIVFTSGGFRGTHREYDPVWAYPAGAALSCLGILMLGLFFARWRRQRPVRLRPGHETKFVVLYVIFTSLAVSFAHSRADTFDGNITPYVAPIWAFLALSVLTLVYQFRSPRNLASTKRLLVENLGEADGTLLLAERRDALLLLERDDLLPEGVTVDQLASRSLGLLHVDPVSESADAG